MTNYQRRQPLDALVVDGEALLLVPPDQVIRLSPIATALFEATATPQRLGVLATMIEARFGAPPEGSTRDALQSVLDHLLTAGVLEEVPDA